MAQNTEKSHGRAKLIFFLRRRGSQESQNIVHGFRSPRRSFRHLRLDIEERSRTFQDEETIANLFQSKES